MIDSAPRDRLPTTFGIGEGCGVIDPRSTSRRAFPPLLGALCLLLSLTAPAPSPAATAVDGAQAVGSPPQLLLIHGGSFLFENPVFEAETETAAIAAGFVPHYLSYPSADLPGAVRAARSAARELRARFGPDVYAYGSSAGGTLASLLAGDGLVAAAVAKAPPSDLLDWQWPLAAYGADYYERIGAGSEDVRRRFSPLRRAARRPLFLVHGRDDQVVPLAMSEAFAAKFRRVYLWPAPGGHWTERARPWVLERALGWLGNAAVSQPALTSP